MSPQTDFGLVISSAAMFPFTSVILLETDKELNAHGK